MTVIEVEGVRVELVKKRVKRMNLHVTPQCIWMSVPYKAPVAVAEAFVRSQIEWIRSRVKICEQRNLLEDTAPLWGEEMPLCFSEEEEGTLFDDGRLILSLPLEVQEEEKHAALEAVYRRELAKRLPIVCAHWEAVTGQKPAEYRLRVMKTRWGTCSLRFRRIWLSTRLAAYPTECLDYVLTHELTHLIVPNHSAKFWAYMDQFYPNWRAIRAYMRQGSG